MQDLVELRQRLEISCRNCKREVAIEPAEAVRLLGAKTTFIKAREKLRCSGCGVRNGGGAWPIDVRPSMQDHYRNLAERGVGVGAKP